MARGLGLALDIPITGIDTLSAISWNAGAGESPLVVAADARRGEVYFALFAADRSPVHPPACSPSRRRRRAFPKEELE